MIEVIEIKGNLSSCGSSHSNVRTVYCSVCFRLCVLHSVHSVIQNVSLYTQVCASRSTGLTQVELAVILLRVCVCLWFGLPTLSPEAEVKTKVEKMGSWYFAFRGQLSTVTPIGRQKTGTDSGRGNASRSSSGYRLIRPAHTVCLQLSLTCKNSNYLCTL